MSADNTQQSSTTVGNTTLIDSGELESCFDVKKVISIPFLGYWFELTFGKDNKFICYRIFNHYRQSLFYGIDLGSPEFNNYVQQEHIQPNNLTSIFIYRLVSRSVNTYLNNNEENSINELGRDNSHLDLINTFVNTIINMNMNNLDSLDIFDQYRLQFMEKLTELSIIPEGIIGEFGFVINNTIRLHVQHILENDISTNDFWKPVDIHISNDDFEKKFSHKRMSKKLRREFSCDNTCTICFEDIRPNQITTLIGCKHVFHKKCAKEWFTKKCNKPLCPCCRIDVRTKMV